jgi:Ca-activated chloride channel family protein
MLRSACGLSLLVVLAAGPVGAQGWIDIERPVGRVGIASGIVVRTASNVRVVVDGRAARVEVEERFRNDGGGLAEGSYLYPMPGDAAFTNFSLWMGGRELRGEVMAAEQARGIYEEIVRRRKDPALLTWAGYGLARAQIFPIQSGETRQVALRYSQLLLRTGDALRFRYVAGSRSGGGETRSFRLVLAQRARYGTPYSPTHTLETHQRGDSLELSLPSGAEGDVEIFVPLRQAGIGTSVVAHAPGGEDGYYMLMLAPPAAQAGGAPAVPRDLTLVVDVSGSMSGPKLEQARAALRQALGTLGPADRFRLIAFSSNVRPFSDSFTSATPAALDRAREFVDRLAADGGTNIAGALDAALGGGSGEGRLPLVVFITDGVPSVGEQAPDRIAERAHAAAGAARVFTVGVGQDVNTYLLDRLAVEGRGSVEYVPPDGNVETAVGALLGKLRQPALVNLRVLRAPVQLDAAEPATLPDLFAGEELVIFGRYHGSGRGELVIEGERNGRRERFAASVDFPEREGDHDYVPRLWASRRIGTLTRQIRIEGANADLVRQVRELGSRYGILTEYTSYLVQEPDQVALLPRDELARRERVSGFVPAAPAAQTGAVAFNSARRSAQLADAKSLAAAEAVASMDESRDAANTRRAGGRLFVRRGATWTDAGHVDTLKVTTVAPYSPAYFELVRALPEIARYLSVGDDVLIAGRRVSLRFATGGTVSWKAGEVAALAARFRGA